MSIGELRLGADILLGTKRMDLYVRAADGDDDNEGSSTYPLETLQAAVDRIPHLVDGIVVIHVGPHTGDGYAMFELSDRILRQNIFFYADGGGGGTDGFTELVAATPALAGSTAQTVKTSGLAVDYGGKTIEILTGAAAGDRRTLQVTTATDLTVARSFTAAVAEGDSYRIVEPETDLELSWPDTENALIKGCGTGERLVYPVQTFFNNPTSVWLINFKLKDPVYASPYLAILQSSISLFGVEFDGSYGSFFMDSSAVKMGVEGLDTVGYVGSAPSGKDVFGAPNDTSWSGWGVHVNMDLPVANFSVTGGSFWGVLVSRGTVVVNNAQGWISGGNLLQGIGIVRPEWPYTYVLVYPEPYLGNPRPLIGCGAGASGVNECVHASGGLLEVVYCTLSGAGDGLFAEVWGRIHDTYCNGTVDGIGARTRTNGQIFYDHAPGITGLAGDLSADDGATTYPKSTLAPAKTALIDSIHGRIFRDDNT